MFATLQKYDWLCGVCLPLSLLLSEPIFLADTLAETPNFFSVRYLLDRFPESVLTQSSHWLWLPALLSFALAIMPVFRRRFQWGPFLLCLAGLSFYPILAFGWAGVEDGPAWAILFLLYLGLNVWIRSVDYIYAASIAALLWDMGAAIRGLMLGIPRLPVPYAVEVPTWFPVAFDGIAAVAFLIAWGFRFDPLGWDRARRASAQPGAAY